MSLNIHLHCSTLHRYTICALLVGPLFGPLSAQAQDLAPLAAGWYLNGHAGYSYFDGACTDNALSCERGDVGLGLSGGFHFTPTWSMELGYDHLGDVDARYGAPDDNRLRLEGDMQLLTMQGRYDWSLSERFGLYAKAGVAAWFADVNSLDGAYQQDGSGVVPVGTVGLRYRLGDSWTTELNYQYAFGVGDDVLGEADSHLVSLGLSYHFGAAPRAVTPPAPTPEPEVHLAPPVEPQTPVTLPATIAPQEVDMEVVVQNSVSLFEFASDEPVSTNPLVEALSYLRNNPRAQAVLVGHTDNVGSEAFNQVLSVKRAQQVAAYFTNRGVAPSRIDVSGRGELAPVASNDTDSGRALNRRVDVEVMDVVHSVEEVQ